MDDFFFLEDWREPSPKLDVDGDGETQACI